MLFTLVKIIFLAIRGYIQERLNLKASALTYSILFAVVPMFALIIAIGRGFGVEDMIEKWLLDSFIAQSDMLPTVMEFVKKYLETTQGGLFIGIGIAILLFSVMNFFIQVELAFNGIWQVKKPRSIVRQFSIYFSAMLVIPVFIVLSSGISIYINTVLSKSLVYELFSPLLRIAVYFTPYFINWLIFTIMYLVIPNTRVKFINALVAGIIAGSAFQLFQLLYINGQVYLSRYNVVYGSFAAIPLLLLWLQISCLIVLLGAEISYVSQNIRNFDFEADSKNISNRYKNFLTLFVTYIIVKQFEAQKPPLSSDEISRDYRLPMRITNEILNNLVDAEVLNEIYNQNNRHKSYQPAIDINQLTVELVYDKLDSYGTEQFLKNKSKDMDDFWQRITALKDKSEFLADKILVKDI
jgi:membrane protein